MCERKDDGAAKTAHEERAEDFDAPKPKSPPGKEGEATAIIAAGAWLWSWWCSASERLVELDCVVRCAYRQGFPAGLVSFALRAHIPVGFAVALLPDRLLRRRRTLARGWCPVGTSASLMTHHLLELLLLVAGEYRLDLLVGALADLLHLAHTVFARER